MVGFKSLELLLLPVICFLKSGSNKINSRYLKVSTDFLYPFYIVTQDSLIKKAALRPPKPSTAVNIEEGG